MLVWHKGVCIMANLSTENGGFDVFPTGFSAVIVTVSVLFE